MRSKSRLVGSLLVSAVVLYLLAVRGYICLSAAAPRPVAVDLEATETTVGNQTKRILLVSALYPLSKSKHSHDEYARWLDRFLSQVTTETYFYAPPSMKDLIPSHVTLNTSYPSVFSVPPLQGLEQQYEKMHEKDRERFRHSPELYAVWNAKPFFLNQAVEHLRETQGKEFDYAFWVDAGSFRDQHVYQQWPDPARVDTVFAGHEGTIFIPIYDLPQVQARWWKEDMGPLDNEVSEGSFFGGSPSAISWYTSTFYKYHSHYLSLGHFVGKDQTLINALLLLFPSRFITVWQRDPLGVRKDPLRSIYSIYAHLGRCGAEWYYYQFFLADSETRRRMRDIWDARVRPPWTKVRWWMEHGRCQLTSVMTMEEALARAFGRGWKRPEATI